MNTTANTLPWSFGLKTFLLLGLVLGLTYILLQPGLSGPFIFDDIPNLSPLGEHRYLDDWTRARLFTFSGEGVLGRPISLASFLLDDTVWPSAPYSFKYTNLLIHLLNGLLVFWLVWLLAQAHPSLAGQGHRQLLLAALTSLAWLLHPLQSSTVFYVIQRMAELAALFTLAGLITYVKWRLRERTGLRSYFFLTSSLALWGGLALFSKENGALLVFYLVVLEYAYFRPIARHPGPRGHAIWAPLILIVPALLLLTAILVLGLQSAAHGFRSEFSLGERLLSETRVLVDYLTMIVAPRLSELGLFHDGYAVSEDWFTPPATLLSALFLLGLVALAIVKRRAWPLFAFAVAWFFAAHAMESTVLPLELYFEHRNYLAILGPLLALGLFASTATPKGRPLLLAVVIVYLLLFAWMSHQNAKLWGDSTRLTLIWAEEHPSSIRAQEGAAFILEDFGQIEAARHYRQQARDLHPDLMGPNLNLLLYDCFHRGQIDPRRIDELVASFTGGGFHISILDQLATVKRYAVAGHCPELDNPAARRILTALLASPHGHSDVVRQVANYHLGQLYAEARQLEQAIETLDLAFQAKPVVDIPLQQAVYLLSAGLYEDALRYVERARQTDNQVQPFFLRGLRRNDIDGVATWIRKLQAESAVAQ